LGRRDLADGRDFEAQLDLAADVRVAFEPALVPGLDRAQAPLDLARDHARVERAVDVLRRRLLHHRFHRVLGALLAGADFARARRAQAAAAAQRAGAARALGRAQPAARARAGD